MMVENISHSETKNITDKNKKNLTLATKKIKKVFLGNIQRAVGAGNNPMVGMTVAVAVAIEEASK